jgi:septal ring factor EnvC (AmiA/AmiB activator)
MNTVRSRNNTLKHAWNPTLSVLLSWTPSTPSSMSLGGGFYLCRLQRSEEMPKVEQIQADIQALSGELRDAKLRADGGNTEMNRLKQSRASLQDTLVGFVIALLLFYTFVIFTSFILFSLS